MNADNKPHRFFEVFFQVDGGSGAPLGEHFAWQAEMCVTVGVMVEGAVGIPTGFDAITQHFGLGFQQHDFRLATQHFGHLN